VRAAGPSSGWVRYGWALLAVVLAIVLRWFGDPRLGTQLPYGSVLVATIVIAWFVGLRPALLVVVLGGIAANFFLQEPRWSFEPGPAKQSWGLVVFMLLGTVISLLGGRAQTQRARAEAAAETLRRAEAALRDARDSLELRVLERTAELARTHDSLHDLEAENRRMQEAARMQSEFLANMSHELRTPLNAIIGFSDLMYRGVTGPLNPEQREFLGDILSSSRHLLGLINDVLDLAKVESGTLVVVPQPVELTRVIAEVRDILRGLAAGRRVELASQLAADLGSVVVDPAKLKQILYNYISNALKFTPEGGRVTIRAELVGDAFRVEVQDTGIGIAKEDLRHLFVAFRQLDDGLTKRYPGTGLGLALSKRLAEAHGGVVGVDSERGVGSTFWVELPRRVATAPSRAEQRQSAT
jgi:signal transduction histidine kinase